MKRPLRSNLTADCFWFPLHDALKHQHSILLPPQCETVGTVFFGFNDSPFFLNPNVSSVSLAKELYYWTEGASWMKGEMSSGPVDLTQVVLPQDDLDEWEPSQTTLVWFHHIIRHTIRMISLWSGCPKKDQVWFALWKKNTWEDLEGTREVILHMWRSIVLTLTLVLTQLVIATTPKSSADWKCNSI